MGQSNAERQARWRAKRDVKIEMLRSGVATASQELAEARKEIARLKQQLAAKAAPASEEARQAIGKLMNAQFDNDRLHRQLAEAHKSEPEQIAILRQRISFLEQERARRDRAAKAAQTKAAKAAAAAVNGEKEPRIAQLEKINSDLRKRINGMRSSHEESLKRKVRMTFAAESLIAKALHPDATPTDADREEALKAFNAWKADSKAAARR